METKKVLFVKPEWNTILKRHEQKCADIQQVVKFLTDNGLTVTAGDLKDLINNGSALYDQAKQKAKSNAGIFTLPAAKEKFIDENTEVLSNAITEAKTELYRVLALNGMNPLNIEAYTLKNGMVSVSGEWIEQLEQSHTIYSTTEKEKAVELIANVEKAIQQLNDHVKDNKFFGSGISTDIDSRRSLCSLSANGEFYKNAEAIEYI